MITMHQTPTAYPSMRAEGPALPWNAATALRSKAVLTFAPFGDRIPTTGPPRGATG